VNDPRSRPSGFLLDLDGVLVHSHRVHVEAYERAFRHHGLELDAEARRMVVGGAGRTHVLAHADVPETLTGPVSRAKEEAFLALLEAGALEAARGVQEVLDALDAAGCPAAVVSNSATARECVSAMGWAPRFQAVVGATDVARVKPDPEPYRRAAALLGVPPEACVAVEDSATGILSAREAGAFVAGVGAGAAPDSVDAWAPELAALPVGRWLGLPAAEAAR
jgi:alpha,alpha-trehalose phosphorylase